MAETKNKWAMEGLTEWRPPPPRPAMCSTNSASSTPRISLVFELDYYSYLDSSSAAQCSFFYGTFEGTLPCSQYLATELHLNPAESNPHSYMCLPICEYFWVIDVHLSFPIKILGILASLANRFLKSLCVGVRVSQVEKR